MLKFVTWDDEGAIACDYLHVPEDIIGLDESYLR
jgi:hypothetical protein